MHRAFASSLFVAFCGAQVLAQTAAPPAAPAQAPAAPRAPRPAATPPAVTVQITDSSGLALAGVQVTAQGPLSRDGVTAADGSVRFTNMRAGTYRLRFTHDGSITLERDITVRAGEPLLVDAMLNNAPPAPKAPEPVAPPPPPVAPKTLGPPSEPKLIPVPTFIEKNFIGRDGRKDSPLTCTSSGSATLIQLREALLNRSNADSDEWIYVVAGEGALRIANADQKLLAGTFALVPHTVASAIVPSGRTPLILISMLAGAPCSAAAASAAR